MEWLETAQGIITLISGAFALIGVAFTTFLAIKNWIALLKTKKADEIWKMIMAAADKAMIAAESGVASGADKKEIVIDAVKASCKEVGLEINPFIDQLSAYIDEAIAFVNNMPKK